MNIAFCTDERYSYPCGVCITSIFENNKDEICNIYILTDGLKPKTIEKFRQLEGKYKQKIDIINVGNQLFDDLKVCDRFPKSIYYRFLLPQLLKEEKIIYFDCDIIVTAKLNALWMTDISQYACGVVEDQCGDDITLKNRINSYGKYFNSGVLLMNLKYWRENDISRKLVNFISSNPEMCLYPDQDALNATIQEQVLYLEYEYNYQQLFFCEQNSIFLHRDKWVNLLAYNVTPTIIHYTHYIKPWHKGCLHPLKDLFMKYKRLSPWYKRKIKSRYSFLEKIELIIKHSIFILRN